MIYVSSTCIKNSDLFFSIDTLVNEGFRHIELSGGSNFIEDLDKKLLPYVNKGISLRLHNYFPPPRKHFVINLCGNGPVVEASKEMLKTSIDLSKELGSTRLGFHAGFRINPKVDELGKPLSRTELTEYNKAVDSFCDNFQSVSDYADKMGVSLYLENNVVSEANFRTYNSQDPFLLTSMSSLLDLKKHIKFKLLLDIGHLKVSCHTLEKNFESELDQMLEHTDYLHISDNSGLADDNEALTVGSPMLQILKNHKNKISRMEMTLEVYSGLDQIKITQEAIQSVIA